MPYLTPKIEYTLKPSNYDAKPWLLPFTAQKSKFPRRFWEKDPEILHTYLCAHAEPFARVCVSFHGWKCGIPWDPSIKNKKTKLKYRAKKERKSPFVQRLSRGTLNACAKFQGLPLKNDADFGLWRIWGHVFEPVCIISVKRPDCNCPLFPNFNVKKSRKTMKKLFNYNSMALRRHAWYACVHVELLRVGETLHCFSVLEVRNLLFPWGSSDEPRRSSVSRADALGNNQTPTRPPYIT